VFICLIPLPLSDFVWGALEIVILGRAM